MRSGESEKRKDTVKHNSKLTMEKKQYQQRRNLEGEDPFLVSMLVSLWNSRYLTV